MPEQMIFSVIILLQLKKYFRRFVPEFVPLHFQFASGASFLVNISDESSFLLIFESVKLSNVN